MATPRPLARAVGQRAELRRHRADRPSQRRGHVLALGRQRLGKLKVAGLGPTLDKLQGGLLHVLVRVS